MTTTTKQKCLSSGEKHHIDEMYKTINGDYIHPDYADEWVNIDGGNIYIHGDDATLCECNELWYPTEDLGQYYISWDHWCEVYRFEDNMCYGWISSSREGWFSNECDYAYSDDRDEYYMSSDIARDCDMQYCENSDDWLHIDDIQDGEEWHNQFRVPSLKESNTFNLTHGMKYTFGVEIETCDSNLDWSDLSLSAVHDGSVNGMEFVTGVLQGDKGLNMLSKICTELDNNHCYVDKTCGLHVHIGGANFNRKFSILAIMLGQMLQDEIYTMLPPSRLTSSYCHKIKGKYCNIKYVSKKLYPRTYSRQLKLLAEYVYSDSSEFDSTNNKKTAHPYGRYHSSRYTWLNLNNCSYSYSPDTVEFRCHSGTTNYTKMYNWILICMCFVRYIENHPRDIIESFKDFSSQYPKPCMLLRDIVSTGIENTDKAIELLEYIDARKDRFKQS